MTRRPDRPRTFFFGIALLGFATGLRSQMGVTAITVMTPSRSLPRLLQPRLARRVLCVATLGELVGDKLPSTPARTEPAGLVARIALGAGAGGLAARSMGLSMAKPARVGALAATASAFVGLGIRRALAHRTSPTGAGLLEDIAAATIAIAGVRLARH